MITQLNDDRIRMGLVKHGLIFAWLVGESVAFTLKAE
jgi:hypothetical protein